MEKATLDTVIKRLDRLEQVVVDMSLLLSLLVKELVPNASENCITNKEITESEAKDEKQDANIGVKIIEGIVERMGYPPDFDPGTIEELHESMRQSGIHAEDNEFSRAIIEERNRGGN